MMVKKTRGAEEQDVGAFITALAHPLAPVVLALRQAILQVDPVIGEAIKWNAPSFHVDGRHFATMQLRRRDAVLLVLHLGVQKRALPKDAIADPEGLLVWLAPDRATVSFAGMEDVATRRPALQAVLRSWMAHA